jgi:hypothetical protein
MKYNEFKHCVNIAGLSLIEFADLIKANPKSITNIASKNHEDSVPKHLSIIAVLMAKMAEGGIDFKEPIEQLSIQHQKYRIKGKFGGDKQGVLEL